MSIRWIEAEELRSFHREEGLVLQGCGGDLQEWVDGINGLLTKEEILLDGSNFRDCTAFSHEGVTCLLFPFSEDIKLNIGKLAAWRLWSYEALGGTWLSDYVPNRLGGYVNNCAGEGMHL